MITVRETETVSLIYFLQIFSLFDIDNLRHLVVAYNKRKIPLIWD